MSIKNHIIASVLVAFLFGSESILGQDLNLLHVVAKRETLYGISRQYSVTKDQLVQWNPFLNDRGLQIGDTLQIPIHLPVSEQDSWSTRKPASADTFLLPSDSDEVPDPTDPSPKFKGSGMQNIRKIALVLPLYTEHHDTLFQFEDPEWPQPVDRKSWAGLEYLTAFEFGLHAALQEDSAPVALFLRDSATFRGARKIQLQVFDGARDTAQLRLFAHSGAWDSFDAVVGPLYSDCLASLARDSLFTRQFSGLWVNPLSSSAFLYDIPRLTHFNTSPEHLDMLMLDYLETLAKQGQVLHVYYHPADTMNGASAWKRLQSYRTIRWHRIQSSTYSGSLQSYSSGTQHIVIWSADRAFTTDLITKINALRSDSIYVYGKAALASMGVQYIYLNNVHAAYPRSTYEDSAAVATWSPIYTDATQMPLTPLAMHAIDLARALVNPEGAPLFYPAQWSDRNGNTCENRGGQVLQLREYREVPLYTDPRTRLPQHRTAVLTSPDR